MFYGRQAGFLFTDLIAHVLVVCSSNRVAQRVHVANDDVRWLFGKCDCDLDFSDWKQTELTVSAQNYFISSKEGTETSKDESESDNDVQPVTGD